MKMLGVFLALAGAGVVAFAALAAWYLGSYQTTGGSMSGMMGQMMGGSGGMSLGMPSSVWFSVVLAVVAILVGVVGLGYYLAFPEIKQSAASAVPAEAPGQQPTTPVGGEEGGWVTLMRTSKPEEKKVLEVLAAHDGHYLQKFVVKEAGLSRLKTHRIVSRFAERGVVTVMRSGNTNEVSLAPWAMKDRQAPSS